MSHGTRLVIKETVIDEATRDILLKHPYFHTYPPSFELQDTLIEGQPESVYDSAVFSFLDSIEYDYTDKIVEYWFQSHNAVMNRGLSPHCDYNFIYREKMKLEGDEWPHIVPRDHIVSPITIAVYLEVTEDLEGGELCISHRSWYEEKKPATVDSDYIKTFPFDTIRPIQDRVLFFKGSEQYHWVNPITAGSRKSMLINFWPKELLDKY